MALERIVISQHADPDFGTLELIETRREVAVNGDARRLMVFRCWERKPTRDEAALIITDTHDPPMVEDEIRETFRSIVSDLSDFKHRVARLELPRARKWATAGGLDLSLDEEGLATLLTIDGFTIGPGRLTVWLGEGAQIFAGHLLEVRIERGEIIEVCLAG